ncbi:MAG: hypothetical protein LBH46_01360 [Rickettsiales bacterium]|nr:hypothetical protein [Rickettsiales bacterium]
MLNIFDREPSTDIEKVCYKWWQPTYEELLEDCCPFFAIKRFTPQKVNYVDPGLENRYVSPDGIIKSQTGNHKNIYSIPNNVLIFLNLDVGDEIIGNELETDREVKDLKYIDREAELSYRETKFNDTLSYYLAYAMSSEITNNPQITQQQFQMKRIKLNDLNEHYSRQLRTRIIKKSKWSKL